jgi:hypothetical protein
MELIEGELHDPLSATYQTLELARLNDVLTECGVIDPQLRRRICETYFFHSGYFLDSDWFAHDGGRFRPGMHFVKLETQNEPSGPVFQPSVRCFMNTRMVPPLGSLMTAARTPVRLRPGMCYKLRESEMLNGVLLVGSSQ